MFSSAKTTVTHSPSVIMEGTIVKCLFLTFCLLLCKGHNQGHQGHHQGHQGHHQALHHDHHHHYHHGHLTTDMKSSHLPNSSDLGQTDVEKTIIMAETDCEENFGILKEASIQTSELLKEASLKTTELLKKASFQAAELLKYAGEKIETGIEHVNMASQRRIDNASRAKQGKTRSVTKVPTRCGDWKPYKDEKCLKIATRAGHKTKEDAELTCQAFSEETNEESYPRLMTIKTKEEQEFIQHFLFSENKVVENVWLGLQKVGKTEDFEWHDGARIEYSNWANQNITGEKHQCVQMASGQELAASGLWLRVTCVKYNIVVCEKTQIWTIENLQNSFMNYRLEQERLFLNQERTFLNYKQEQDQKNEALEKETDNLKRNPVPLGFIYVQLATQEPPFTLWPQTNWTDVSSSYAGLFFRVVGGNAAPFGQIQEGNSSRLEEVDYTSGKTNTKPLKIPSDGSWSQYIFTGTSSGTYFYQQFRLSGAEVRPRNQAMKIWKRIQ